jgi:NTP pyrophosphatase (non-canonical NTP hydrolase)
MQLNDYQTKASRTALYPTIGKRYVYPALGLANEAGEVLGKIKKVFRDHNGVLTKEYKLALKKELGDVLWYVAMLAKDLGFKLDDLGKDNLKKLASRAHRGKITGDGDNR